jgi:PTH1 family peptidyl-tRNA hydrolase
MDDAIIRPHVAIVGLGNPWETFKATRHNLGARVVTRLVADLASGWEKKSGGWIAHADLDGKHLLVIRPEGDINISGELLAQCIDLNLLASELWIVHDDMSINTGSFRIRRGGGSGGHRGMQSIIEILGQRDLLRMKIGISYPRNTSINDYVVAEPPPYERAVLDQVVLIAAKALTFAILNGIDEAQNKFNGMASVSAESG